MTEDRDALIEHYRRMREDLLAAIDGLNEAALSEPSLDGWAVKDHLAHLALWDEIRASEVERISAGYEPAWPRWFDSEAHNAMIQPARQALSLEQVRWELEMSRQRVLAAIACRYTART
jgi:uncharacterized damage-inducible protein DinB